MQTPGLGKPVHASDETKIVRRRPNAQGGSLRGLRFTRAKLRHWRNFTAVDIELQRRAFLVGPNASGKSNFLDAFRFLRDVASIGGGLAEAVRRRGGVSKVRALAARRVPGIAVHVHIGDDDSPSAWEYELTFTQDTLRRPRITCERVVRNGVEILNRPDSQDERDQERLTQTYLEQVNVNLEFRPVAHFLASVRYLHIVPQLIREPDRSVGRQNDPFGGDFLEHVARTPKRIRRAWLRRIQGALRVAVPQLGELELTHDIQGTPHLRGKYEHWRPRGAWQSEEQFSDGTLRLLGLLWIILEGSGPVLLEEPELSLHPEVVRFIPQMFARAQRRTGRQVILSTHSSDLLRDQGIGLDEVLLLEPGAEGTVVKLARDFDDIRALLEGDASLADAVIPRTRPLHAHQLSLFAD